MDEGVETGDDEVLLQGRTPVVPVATLLKAGYAVAGFHTRGTGNSGGCFDMFGAAEQADQKVLVDWVARQPWSDGTIAASDTPPMPSRRCGRRSPPTPR